MKYEAAVLAAMVQSEKATTPAIEAMTGISARRIRTAIENLKSLMGIDIAWKGANRSGHYEIISWGAFESGVKIQARSMAIDLQTYKSNKTLVVDPIKWKKHYINLTKHENYKHSLRLEGLKPDNLLDVSRMNRSARLKLKQQYISKVSGH